MTFFLILLCTDKHDIEPRTPLSYVEQAAVSLPLYAGMTYQMSDFSFTTENIQSVLYGWVAIDFLSGLLHMALDHIHPQEQTKWYQRLAYGFQQHHTHPHLIVTDPFWFQNREAHILGLMVLAASFLTENSYGIVTSAFFASFANFIHACSHGKHSDSGIVKMLQNTSVILSPENHRKHHSNNHEYNFCVISGITNPVLNKMKSLFHWGRNFLTHRFAKD
jgi:hypothetical protein